MILCRRFSLRGLFDIVVRRCRDLCRRLGNVRVCSRVRGQQSVGI